MSLGGSGQVQGSGAFPCMLMFHMFVKIQSLTCGQMCGSVLKVCAGCVSYRVCIILSEEGPVTGKGHSYETDPSSAEGCRPVGGRQQGLFLVSSQLSCLVRVLPVNTSWRPPGHPSYRTPNIWQPRSVLDTRISCIRHQDECQGLPHSSPQLLHL